MRGRIGRVALLLFQALWLNVILPGHTRGIITLPGTDRAEQTSSCCAKPNPIHAKDAPGKPAPKPAACAVCFFAARLSLPDGIDLTPPALGLIALSDIPLSRQLAHAPLPLPFDGRGPPLA